MKKLAIVLLVALMAVGLMPARPSSAQAKVVRLTLIDENGSGEDGSAQLTDQGDGTTKVELLMLNAPEGAVQPAHIHEGSCATLNPAPAFPLTNVVEGKSTTIVKASLADLTSKKYAINVHKSAAEASVYISCGNLPTSTAASTGPMTVAQAFTTLLDQAQELEATVKKHEADASQAAYDLYHGTFAANEDAIKAKDAATQLKLEDAMHGVRDAVAAGDWTKSEAAAAALVQAVKAGQTMMGGTTDSAMTSTVTKFQTAANDLVRETGNQDKAGAQAAYTAFEALFTANDAMLKAQNPTLEGNISAPLAEVKDALAAGNWTTAAASSKEIQGVISDAMQQMGMSTNTLPTSGNGSLPLTILLLAGAGLALLGLGTTLRRRTTR